MQKTDCTFICEQFTEYQDNTLSTEIRARVDAHLASCANCHSTFQNLSNLIDTLHNLPKLKASENFSDSLLSRIETMNQETPWQKIYQSTYTRVAGYAIAAGLVVALGVNMLIDPISPLQKGGAQSGFAGEAQAENSSTESYAGIADSAAIPVSDSLATQSAPINSQNQSMQLVSGKK